jgi:hypothetical protein
MALSVAIVLLSRNARTDRHCPAKGFRSALHSRLRRSANAARPVGVIETLTSNSRIILIYWSVSNRGVTTFRANMSECWGISKEGFHLSTFVLKSSYTGDMALAWSVSVFCIVPLYLFGHDGFSLPWLPFLGCWFLVWFVSAGLDLTFEPWCGLACLDLT